MILGKIPTVPSLVLLASGENDQFLEIAGKEENFFGSFPSEGDRTSFGTTAPLSRSHMICSSRKYLKKMITNL